MTKPNHCERLLNYFRSMSRKKLIIIGASVSLSVVLIIIIIVLATTGTKRVDKGSDALTNTPLVDGHNDLPYNLRMKLKNSIKDFKFDTNLWNDTVWGLKNCNSCFTDLPRLRQGKVGAQFWVAYVSCSEQYKDAVSETLEQIDVIKRLVKKYSNDMQLVTTADGIMDAFENGKIGSMIAVEGGHSIDSRLGVLRTYYDLGARYMTLTHTCNTPWADGSPATSAPVHNLTEYGKKVVHEMNRLGMMVDLSHVSANVMREAIAASKAPVIFSHSSAYEIHPHPRNVPDDVLKLVKTNEGIVMVNFYKGFLGDENGVVTISDAIAHINHIAKIAGPDYVGIGADYDGVEAMPVGLEDVSKYPVLFDLLHTNNSDLWTIDNLEKLAGKNLIRVFQKVEEVRDEMKTEDVVEDWISESDLNLNVTEAQCRNKDDVAFSEGPPVTTVPTSPTKPTAAPTSPTTAPTTPTTTLTSSTTVTTSSPKKP